MRILVLTNHFAEIAGSETVALEVAEWFRDRGDEVTLASNHIALPIKAEARNIALADDVEDIALETFDLVWCQHDLLSQLPLSALERAADIHLPHIAFVTLSPFEPYEHLNVPFARALSADLMANSAETREEMVRRHAGYLARDDVRVFFNAAPAAFHAERQGRVLDTLQHITLVSNHPPPEILAALDELGSFGIGVRLMGQAYEWKRLGPDDLDATSAIVTIGKTTVFCLARGVPVYLYDHLGGDGWLMPNIFARVQHYNFSGRPSRRRLSAPEIVREIRDGFEAAAAAAHRSELWGNLPALELGRHLDALRQRAIERPKGAAAAHLKAWLNTPGVKARFEASRQKSLVMKRSYKIIYGSS